MLVMLDEPKTEKWGSEAAAPIFASIGREILRYLEVPPHDVPPVQIVSTPDAPAVPRLRLVSTVAPMADGRPVMPDLRGRTLRQALAALAPGKVGVALTGRGVVAQQDPAPGSVMEPGTRVRLVLAPPSRAEAGGR
jgi:beta-lactam-binding protein with PASTA domain